MILDNFKGRFAVIAHRCNSMEAFTAAAKAGADFIHTMAHRSWDGPFFCSDERAVDVRLPISETSASSLVDGGMLRLSEALDFAKDNNVPLVVEVKDNDPDAGPDILKEISRHGMLERTVIGTHSIGQTWMMRQTNPDVEIAGFLSPDDCPDFYEAGGSLVCLREKHVTPQNLRLAEHDVKNRRPVWVIPGFYRDHPTKRNLGDIDLQGLFTLQSAPVAAKGVIVNDPAQAVQAVRRFKGPLPAYGSFPGD